MQLNPLCRPGMWWEFDRWNGCDFCDFKGSYPCWLSRGFDCWANRVSSPISHFHYNYSVLWDRYDCPHGYKACLNVGPAVSARSWLLSTLLSAGGGRNLGLNPRRLWSPPYWRSRTREIYTSMQYGHVFFFFCNHTRYTEYSHKSSTAPTMASFGICTPGSIIGQKNADREGRRPFVNYVE